MRAIIYCRLSSWDQGGWRMKCQTDECLEYAQNMNYKVVDILREGGQTKNGNWRGQPGDDWDAPALNEALRRARLGEFDVLICRSPDRFSRGEKHAMFFDSEFEKAGVSIEFAWEEDNSVLVEAINKIPPEVLRELNRYIKEQAYSEAAKHGKTT